MQQSLVLKRTVDVKHQYLWIDTIDVELSFKSEQNKIPCKAIKNADKETARWRLFEDSHTVTSSHIREYFCEIS